MCPTNWEIDKAEKRSHLRCTLGFGNKTFSSEETSSLRVVRRWGGSDLVRGKRAGDDGKGKTRGRGGGSPSHRPPRACYFLFTVEPPLSGHLWNGHPLLSGQLSKSQNNCTKEWEIAAAATFWSSQREFFHCCHLRPWSSWYTSPGGFFLHFKNMMKENTVRDRSWRSYVDQKCFFRHAFVSKLREVSA